MTKCRIVPDAYGVFAIETKTLWFWLKTWGVLYESKELAEQAAISCGWVIVE